MRLITFLFMVLLLAGCGKKGALYLPDEPPSKQKTTQPTP